MTGIVITATGPEAQATVVTTAIAALAVGRGAHCSVLKLAETGLTDGASGALAEVARLAGPDVELVELARYPDLLSPAAAARCSGRPAVDLAECVQAVLAASRVSDLVLVEGVGGLLVRYDDDGLTIAGVARALRWPVLVVAPPGPGMLNATALTLEALAARGLELAGVVLTGWPTLPGLAERSDIADLERLSGRLLAGVLPVLPACADFVQVAASGLGPALGGRFDASSFRRIAAVH